MVLFVHFRWEIVIGCATFLVGELIFQFSSFGANGRASFFSDSKVDLAWARCRNRTTMGEIRILPILSLVLVELVVLSSSFSVQPQQLPASTPVFSNPPFSKVFADPLPPVTGNLTLFCVFLQIKSVEKTFPLLRKKYSEISEDFQKFANVLKRIQKYPNIFRNTQTCSDISELPQVYSKFLSGRRDGCARL